MCEMEEECCHLCLSTQRRLSSLEGVLDVYLLLVDSDPDGDLCKEDIRGCWECLALLRRVARFRRQARWVRDLLDTADEILLDKDMSLSKLKCTAMQNINKNAKIELSIDKWIMSIDIQPKPITREESSQTSQDRQFSETQDGSMNDTDPLALPVKDEEDETTDTKDEPALSDDNEQIINEEVYDRSTSLQNKFEENLNEPLVFFPVTQLKSSVSQQSEDCQKPDNMEKVIDSPQVNSTDMTKSLLLDVEQVNGSSVEILKLGGSTPRLFDHLDEIPDSDREPTILQPPLKSDTNTPSNTSRLNVKETLLKNIILTAQHRDSQFSNIKMTTAVENRDSKLKENVESTINEKKNPSSLLKNIVLFLPKDPKLQSTQFLINRPIENAHPESVLSTSVTPHIENNGSETVKIRITENPKFKLHDTLRSSIKILGDSQTSNKEKIEINAKQFYESFHSKKSYDLKKRADLKYVRIPVTSSQLYEFLENARNNEKYLASPFKCKFCILGFNKESSLKKHMDIYNHESVPPTNFTCNICHCGMTSPHTLNAHQSTHRFLYSCVAKDFVSVSPQIVLRHYARMHAEKKLKLSEQNVQNTLLYEALTPSAEDLKNMAKPLNITPSGYSCNDCCRQFSSEKLFLSHRKLHSEEAGAHACEYCKMRFPTEDKLADHRPIHDNWYRCKANPSCQYIAPTYHDLYYSHNKKHNKTKRLEMMAAKRRFKEFKPTEEELKNVKFLTGFKPSVVTCDDCCLYFRTDDEVFQHRQLHSDAAGAHVCSVCTQRFTSAELLSTHRRVHDTWYRCIVEGCQFTSNTRHRMQVHTRKHGHPQSRSFKKQSHPKIRKRVGPFQCDVCKKMFTKFVNLQAHIGIHYKQHMCDRCGVLLISRTSLATHKRSHIEKDTFFYCEYCPKRYTSASKLKYHTNEHRNLHPFSCSKCKEKFSSPAKRLAHKVLEHDKSKRRTQSKCSVCSIVFTSHFQLMKHYMIHEELFKYKCDRCPRVFMTFNNFVNHQTKHVSGPSLGCDICGKKFHFLSSLNLHTYRSHKTQVCADCGRRFSSLKALWSHKKLRHASENSIALEK